MLRRLADKNDRQTVPSFAWGILALLCLAVIPIALGLLEVPLSKKRSLYLVLFDPILWITASWLLIGWLKNKILLSRLRLFLCSAWPALLLLLVAGISFLIVDFRVPQAKSLFAKSMVQWFEYFVLGVLVFHTLLSDQVWRRRALLVFSLAGLLTVVSVFVYHSGNPDLVFYKGGILLNRHSYGTFMVILLPVIVLTFGNKFSKQKKVGRVIAMTLMFLLLATITSGAPFLAATLSATIALSCINRLLPIVMLAGSLLIAGFVNKDHLIDSVQVFVAYENPDTKAMSYEHTMRYYRWSANMELLRDKPVLGVGLGQYQKHIKKYYGPNALPSGRTDLPSAYNVKNNEPFTFGMFFVVASELGLLGAGALLFLLFDCVRSGFIYSKKNKMLFFVIAGCVVGVLVCGWFTSFLTRGCGGAFAFLLALAYSREE